MALTRTGLQELAAVRPAEAGALLAAGLWDGAYYLAGCAVECALKACILALVERTGIIFEDKKFAEKCWTHDPETLMTLAKLMKTLDADRVGDPLLDHNWLAVRAWDEKTRYVRTSETLARELYVTDPAHGVLTWVRQYW